MIITNQYKTIKKIILMTLEEINIEINDLKNELLKSREEINSIIEKSKKEIIELNGLIKRSNNVLRGYIATELKRERTLEAVNVESVDLAEILKVENYQISSYTLNTKSRLLSRGNSVTKLTRKEMHLLALLAANQNEIVNRTYLLLIIWGDASYFNGRSMDVYICKIRKLLKDDDSINLVNFHGRGYKLITL